jgi:hypothetical protein
LPIMRGLLMATVPPVLSFWLCQTRLQLLDRTN